MNPLMLKNKQKKLKQELDMVDNLLTAPLRYLESVKRTGTALGKKYKSKLKAA